MSTITVNMPVEVGTEGTGTIDCPGCCDGDCLWGCTDDALEHDPCCRYLDIASLAMGFRLEYGGVNYGNLCVDLQHLGCGLYFAHTSSAVKPGTGLIVNIPAIRLRYRCVAAGTDPSTQMGWQMEVTVGGADPVAADMSAGDYGFGRPETVPTSGGSGDTAWTISDVGIQDGYCCSCDTICECQTVDPADYPGMPAHSPYATICVRAVMFEYVDAGAGECGTGIIGPHDMIWAMDWFNDTATGGNKGWRGRPCCGIDDQYEIRLIDPDPEGDPSVLPGFGFAKGLSQSDTGDVIRSRSICRLLQPLGDSWVFPGNSDFPCYNQHLYVVCDGCPEPFQGGTYAVYDGGGCTTCQDIGPPFVYPPAPAIPIVGPYNQQSDGSSSGPCVGSNGSLHYEFLDPPYCGGCRAACGGSRNHPGTASVQFPSANWGAAPLGPFGGLYAPGISSALGFVISSFTRGDLALDPAFRTDEATCYALNVYYFNVDDYSYYYWLTLNGGVIRLELGKIAPADRVEGLIINKTAVLVWSGSYTDCCGPDCPDPPPIETTETTYRYHHLIRVANNDPASVPSPPNDAYVDTGCCRSVGEVPTVVGSSCVGSDCRQVFSPATPEYPGDGGECPPNNCLTPGYACVEGVGCRYGLWSLDSGYLIFPSLAACASVCSSGPPDGCPECLVLGTADIGNDGSDCSACNGSFLLCWVHGGGYYRGTVPGFGDIIFAPDDAGPPASGTNWTLSICGLTGHVYAWDCQSASAVVDMTSDGNCTPVSQFGIGPANRCWECWADAGETTLIGYKCGSSEAQVASLFGGADHCRAVDSGSLCTAGEDCTPAPEALAARPAPPAPGPAPAQPAKKCGGCGKGGPQAVARPPKRPCGGCGKGGPVRVERGKT